MFILMFVMLIGFMATIILASTAGNISSKKKLASTIHVALLVVSIMLTGFSFAYSIHASNTVVGDAKQVGIVDPARNVDSGTIYYDSESNEYFYVKMNDWNLTNPVYRFCLDEDTAKTYADAYENLVSSIHNG